MSDLTPNEPEIVEKPLARAKLRLKRFFGMERRPVRLPVEVREHRVAELVTTEGLTQREIAQQVGVSPQTVARDLAKPHVQQTVKEMREAIKRVILEESARDIIAPAMEMAREKIAQRDAKGFDATMRGLNALEKTTQSASGEALKVEQSITSVTIDRREIFARIEGILGRTE